MINKNKKGEPVFSITAFIDLLGFSSHLELASFDLRTEVGKSAFSRLEIIESAIEKFEVEQKLHPQLYPKGLRFQRINDALILGIDIDKVILPKIGQSEISTGFRVSDLEDLTESQDSEEKLKAYDKIYGGESINTCLFMGLVARIHTYINDQERNINMPGCRTVISSGLRFRFYDRNKNEDFNSANFSFTNAFLVNEAGSKKGFEGNNLYVDDNVTKILHFNNYTKRLVGFANYLQVVETSDPYSGLVEAINLGGLNEFKESGLIGINLFGKEYTYRKLNTGTLTNFQLINSYISASNRKVEFDNSVVGACINAVINDTPSLIEVNKPTKVKEFLSSKFQNIFLFLVFPLDDDAGDAIEFFESDRKA